MTEQTSSAAQIRLPLILAAVLAAGMFIGQQLPHSGRHTRFLSAGPAGKVSGTIDEVLRYIDARYVDTIDQEQLKGSAINHLLEQLDPHSVYITPDELQAVDDDMSGGFEGIGVEFMMVDDTIQVVTPLSGGPSEAAGILAGDKIIQISDTVVAGVKIDNGQIFKKLRGSKGSKVKIGILRGHENTLRAFIISRDIIPVKSVEIAYMLDPQTGYVKINRFSARTYQEFMDAVHPLVENNHLQDLVLDLRGNPGGYLNEATDLLSQFFPDGKLLVYTKGRTEERRDYKSNGRARFNIRNIAVLVDEGSASASEIVAGAIQDHDRGWVIGRRSFGKGLVQEQYPLSDGGALRLTVARYFTPSGRCIQRDYKHDKDYAHEAERRLKNGELSDGHRTKPADSTQYYTGLGRIVYGGGGISPDIFIPLDTAFFNNYFFEMRQHLPQFVAKWMEGRDRSAFPADLNAFVRDFNPDDNLFHQFTEYGQKEGVHANPQQMARSANELRHQLKARIAKILFQDAGLYTVLNSDDPVILKAISVLKSGERLK
jgi:carboxyl-terminal processing protease